MIGLSGHARDAALPACAGDAAAPSEADVLALVAEHLAPASPPTAAEWTYARWKPHTALTASYEVAFACGVRHVVTVKWHAGAKLDAPAPYAAEPASLRAFAAVPELALTLTVFPFDRELPGLPRCFDLRRVARRVDELGLYAPLHVRPGPSRVATLRYKPERRAVLALDLRLRERDGSPRVPARLALRVHPPAAAREIAARRAALARVAPASLVPTLLGAESRTGVLVEEWLDVAAFGAGSFDHATESGALLARLHGLPCPRAPDRAVEAFDEWVPRVPAFARARRIFERVRSPRTAWVHGDFHPDQVAVASDGSGLRLLDLDALRAGDPSDDLAAWIADHVAARGVDWREAAAPLRCGYERGGGAWPDERELADAVARALVRLAAGALRRLERGAVAIAERRLAEAEAIAPEPASFLSVVERFDYRPPGWRIATERDGDRTRWFEERGSERSELTPATDPELPLARALGDLAEQGRVEVLAYRPRRRMTVRFVADDGARVVVKGYRRGRDSIAAERARIACEAARELSARVPSLLEHDGERSALVASDLGGEPLALGSIALDRMRAFGADLRRFQDSAAGAALAAHDATRELAVSDELASRARALGRELAAGWREARDEIARAAERLAHGPPVLAHRDLHDGQLLDLGQGLGWIDFDLACRADAALDAGNFIAHFELRRLQCVAALDVARVAALRASFLAGLGRARESAFAERLAFYEGASYLRLSLVYALRPPWAHLAPTLALLARERARSRP